MKIKIVGYNICHGFYTKQKPCIHLKKRQNTAKRIIKKENPDILVLTEASFSSPYAKKEYKIYQDYKRIFNYPHIASGFGKKKGGIVVLAKFPLNSEDFSKPRENFLRVWFKINRRIITLDAIHPSGHLKEQEKYKFIKRVLRAIKKPYIIAGDFNGLSPKDPYSKIKLVKGFRKLSPMQKKKLQIFCKER